MERMMTYAEKEVARLQLKIKEHTYNINGVLIWKSNDRPVPVDVFKDAKVEAPAGQKEACDKNTAEFLAEYRKNYKGPTAEEFAEMRAAFGPGTELVNVVTGNKYRV